MEAKRFKQSIYGLLLDLHFDNWNQVKNAKFELPELQAVVPLAVYPETHWQVDPEHPEFATVQLALSVQFPFKSTAEN